ncbi:MAG TPA: penicillin-binding transpeptidase domain-containing protein, partial [Humisphaera sp.]
DKLVADEIGHPTLNRATQAQLQPGSTIKPVVGLSAITQGIKVGDNPLTPDTGIECTGFLVINGKKFGRGRCWVESKYGRLLKEKGMSSAHHQVPSGAEHPTGFLTFGDALERSCNVYFETLADYMGMDGLSTWYERFGLGRPTGLGIPEARGRLPRSYVGPALDRRYKTWFSGIGQDPVSATPIQMANVAATMARGGRWYRPRLVSADVAAQAGVKLPALTPAARDVDPDDADPGQAPAAPPEDWPEAYDLQLNPAAVAAMRDGMQRVVYGRAGTGKPVARKAPALDGIRICGKTGTAQVGRFALPKRDPATGQQLRDEVTGKLRWDFPDPNSQFYTNPDKRFAWYRAYGDDGKDLNHAWYIGFAPAENPKVAFAVMVEYGGSGGMAAGAVARQTLTACVETGYLEPGAAPAGPKAGARPAELLHDVAAR